MTVLLVLFMILLAIGIDAIHHKIKDGLWFPMPAAVNQQVFYNPRVGYSMADGGKLINYRVQYKEGVPHIERRNGQNFEEFGVLHPTAEPREVSTIIASLNNLE